MINLIDIDKIHHEYSYGVVSVNKRVADKIIVDGKLVTTKDSIISDESLYIDSNIVQNVNGSWEFNAKIKIIYRHFFETLSEPQKNLLSDIFTKKDIGLVIDIQTLYNYFESMCKSYPIYLDKKNGMLRIDSNYIPLCCVVGILSDDNKNYDNNF